MSTDYTVVCSSGGNSTTIKIIDSWVPVNDTWEGDAQAWGEWHKGGVANWGTKDLKLTSGVPSTPHILYGFTSSVNVDDTGKGSKMSLQGTFPDGEFTWTCTKID